MRTSSLLTIPKSFSIIITLSILNRSLLRKTQASFLARGAIAVGYNPHFYLQTDTPQYTTKSIAMTKSVDQFLAEQKTTPSKHLVIGNEAGDADSIISAIGLAYVESVGKPESDSAGLKTPIVSIPKEDLKSQRPETVLLMELAGISHAVDHLFFVNSDIVTHPETEMDVTLVDHNRLGEDLVNMPWKVVEILDHHRDEGQYLDTCSGESRNIAFADGQAQVASASTLVVERLRDFCQEPYPSSLSTLLLGAILLDSVNMLPAAGKGTARDAVAIQSLLNGTNWSDLSEKTKSILQVSEGTGEPNSTAMFEALQNAKFDLEFWRALSVRDALRLDYKEFTIDNDSEESSSFGVSTVLMPLNDFLSKSNASTKIDAYMKENDVTFLGIMLAFTEGDSHRRQLVLCGLNGFPLQLLVDYLIEHNNDDKNSLWLQELEDAFMEDHSDGLAMRFYDQGNAKASRKQVAPILTRFFERSTTAAAKL